MPKGTQWRRGPFVVTLLPRRPSHPERDARAARRPSSPPPAPPPRPLPPVTPIAPRVQPDSTSALRINARPARRGALMTLVLLALAAAGCQPPSEGGGSNRVDAAAVRERKLPRVLVEGLRIEEMVAVRETTCVLESELEIALMPRIAARVLAIGAEEGDRVEAGDVLMELDQADQSLALRDAEIAVQEAEQNLENSAIAIDEAQSRLTGSQASLEQAERDYERDAELSRGGSSGVASVSQKAFEQSQLAYAQAQQDLAQAQLALARVELDQKRAQTAVDRAVVARDRAAEELRQCKLRAPFDGVIAERQVRVGQMSSTAESAFTITDPDRLRAVFFRPQRELGLFSNALLGEGPSLELTATTDALAERDFKGTIQRVSPTIDATSGNFRVTAEIDPIPVGGEHPELLPGMLLRLRIVTDRHVNALVCPKRAVQREGGEAYVFELVVGSDGSMSVARVAVLEGFSSEEDIEITPLEAGRLTEGTTIVTVGARDLSDGDAVDAPEMETSAEASAEASPVEDESAPESDVEAPLSETADAATTELDEALETINAEAEGLEADAGLSEGEASLENEGAVEIEGAQAGDEASVPEDPPTTEGAAAAEPAAGDPAVEGTEDETPLQPDPLTPPDGQA